MRCHACLLAAAFSIACSPALADTQPLTDALVRGVVVVSGLPSSALGTDATGIGDFNGDGIDDLALGDAPDPKPVFPPSDAYVVFGRRDFTARLDITGAAGVLRIHSFSPTFGTDVIKAGDMDGDGFADLLIHQPFKTRLGPEIDPHLYLLYGSNDLPQELDVEDIGGAVRGAVFTGAALPTKSFKNPIAVLPDFNGDGTPDLVLGQPLGRAFLGERGLVTVLFGDRDHPWTGTLDVDAAVDAGKGLRIWGTHGSDELHGFGTSVASAGDVDQDGLTDLLVSDPFHRGSQNLLAARVHLIHGSRELASERTIETLNARVVTVENDTDIQGGVVDIFGGADIGGDGFPDFGLSLYEYVDGAAQGRLFFVKGGPGLPSYVGLSSLIAGTSGFELTPPTRAQGVTFGETVVLAPDENGDGRAEVLIGQHKDGGVDLVYPGALHIAPDARPLHAFPMSTDPRLAGSAGQILDAAGDVNADGSPDYVLASPDIFGDPTDFKESRVYVVFGGFETQAFTIRDVTPRRAAVGESVLVTVSGTGFVTGVDVIFGGEKGSGVQVLDPHTLTVTAPVASGPRTVDLTLVHPDGRSVAAPAAFAYFGTRRVAVNEIRDVAIFESDVSSHAARMAPGLVGDVNGDGIDELTLSVNPIDGGEVLLVYGVDRSWSGRVPAASVRERSAVIRNAGGEYPLEVSAAGDLNGDGKGEILVTKPYGDYLRDGRSELVVLFEAPRPGIQVDFSNLIESPDAAYAWSASPLSGEVFTIGDFDGDGTADFATRSVGASGWPGPYELLVILGPFRPGDRLDLDADPQGRVFRLVQSGSQYQFPYFAGPLGDFDGDGLSDVALLLAEPCCLFSVLLGHAPSAGLAERADVQQSGLIVSFKDDQALTQTSLDRAGDLNRDGFDDLLFRGSTNDNAGYAGVLLGRSDTQKQTTFQTEVDGDGGFILTGEASYDLLGADAVAPTDTDGNGTPDFVVGAYRVSERDGSPKPGLVYIVHDVEGLRGQHSIAGVPRPLTVLEGAAPGDRFGYTVKVLGDQDGDRLPEILVEAPFLDILGSGRSRGLCYLIRGRSLFGPEPPVRFVRGDTNRDETVNISDAVYTLGVLFLGEGSLACEDAADANDDGKLDITDAVYLLGFLFLGGEGPPSPFPGAGIDTTADPLGCLGAPGAAR